MRDVRELSLLFQYSKNVTLCYTAQPFNFKTTKAKIEK